MAQKINIRIDGDAVSMTAYDSDDHLMATSWYRAPDEDAVAGQLTTLLDGKIYKIVAYEVTT